MVITFRSLWARIAWLAIAAGCGDSSGDIRSVAVTLGPEGGSVAGPDGVRLDVPPGALSGEVTFRITRGGSAAPPVPGGAEIVGHIYELTPHGTELGAGAVVTLPLTEGAIAGRPAFLMKASPGGRWTVLGPALGDSATGSRNIASLSYIAVAACTNEIPAQLTVSQVCPALSSLTLELLDSSGLPYAPTTPPQPVLTVGSPATLTVRLTWTRPEGIDRLDELSTGTASAGGLLVRTSGYSWGSAAPHDEAVDTSVTRTFSVDVTPGQVA